MKIALVYTEKEHDTCQDFIRFLSNLSEQMDNAAELPKEREIIIDKTQELITEIMDFFPVDERME